MGEQRSWPWICIGALWAAACTGGTDTGNPLTDLDISECKSEGGGQALTAARSALTGPCSSTSAWLADFSKPSSRPNPQASRLPRETCLAEHETLQSN